MIVEIENLTKIYESKLRVVAIAALIDAVVQAIVVGYLGIVMAKVYSTISFTGPRW